MLIIVMYSFISRFLLFFLNRSNRPFIGIINSTSIPRINNEYFWYSNVQKCPLMSQVQVVIIPIITT